MGEPAVLPEMVLQSLAEGGGVVSRKTLMAIGVSPRQLRTWHGLGQLVPLAKGVYTSAESIRQVDPWQRLVLATRAFLLASPPACVAAEWSAVALLGLPHPMTPPAVPTVIRQAWRSSGSNRTPSGRTRFAGVPDRWVMTVNGVRCLRPAFAAVDLGRTLSPLWSLIVADAVAATGAVGELQLAWEDMRKWPRIGLARWAVDRADPDVESPVESAGRAAFLLAGIEPPLSNVWLGVDRPTYRADHYWAAARLVAEGDGMGKYGLNGGDPMARLRAEKEREFALQDLGVRVYRYGWHRATRQRDLLAAQVMSLLSQPPLPAAPGLRVWTAAEGRRLRGLPEPTTYGAMAHPLIR